MEDSPIREVTTEKIKRILISVMHESHTISEERFEFTSSARNKILIVGALGVLLLVIGILTAGNGTGEEHGGGHGAVLSSPSNLVASLEPVQAEAKSVTE